MLIIILLILSSNHYKHICIELIKFKFNSKIKFNSNLI